MKVDVASTVPPLPLPPPVLPLNLLYMKPPMVLETPNFGQLCREYDVWAYAVCEPQHVPKRATLGAAGYGLFSTLDVVVPVGGSVLVPTGLSVQLPVGHYGKIEGCSSLAMNHSIMPLSGIVNEDYHEEIIVKLFNMGSEEFIVHKDERICQLIVQKYTAPMFQVVTSLSPTVKKTTGFECNSK